MIHQPVTSVFACKMTSYIYVNMTPCYCVPTLPFIELHGIPMSVSVDIIWGIRTHASFFHFKQKLSLWNGTEGHRLLLHLCPPRNPAPQAVTHTLIHHVHVCT